MAKARWMAAKIDRERARATVRRWSEDNKAKRALSMPEHKHANDALIAEWLHHNTPKRATTGKRTTKAPQGHTGMMPERSYGVTMKARGNLAGQLWTGGKGQGNLCAAPPMKGALIGNW
jgi:hypothetical protein